LSREILRNLKKSSYSSVFSDIGIFCNREPVIKLNNEEAKRLRLPLSHRQDGHHSMLFPAAMERLFGRPPQEAIKNSS